MTPCAYCGAPVTARDHVVPRNLLGRIEDWRERTVPATPVSYSSSPKDDGSHLTPRLFGQILGRAERLVWHPMWAGLAPGVRSISRSQTNVQPVFDAIVASAVRLLGAYSGALTRIAGD